MTKQPLLLFAVILMYAPLYAQHRGNSPMPCMAKRMAHLQTANKPTVADAGEDNYDVRYLEFDLSITDTSGHIRGSVATTAKVVSASLTEYVFELHPDLVVDSAKINGTTFPVVSTGSVRKIAFTPSVAAGSSFRAQVYYHGLSPATGVTGDGLQPGVYPSGTKTVRSTSEPYGASLWWPCKQSLTDKIDSVDMRMTVPAGVTGTSNGMLLDVDNTTSPGYSIYHWKNRYPIDYYLVSVAAAHYTEERSYVHFTASTDSMLLDNFLVDAATLTPSDREGADSMAGMINFFSDRYGRYPFWKEKYGISMAYYGGGMEHQTLSTQYDASLSLTAHEMAHQWFGDNVTQKSWADIWLSECFATFAEEEFAEHKDGAATAISNRQSDINYGISSGGACGRIYVSDTTVEDSIFTATQYSKAAITIYTLRLLAPHDSLFYKALRTYHQTFGLGVANTNDLKGVFESVYGFALDDYFNQWIYGRGHPLYRCIWNQVGDMVYFRLTQTVSCPTYTAHFNTPMDVRFLSAGSAFDTVVRIYNSLDTQYYAIPWSHTAVNVTPNFDKYVFTQVLSVFHDVSMTGVPITQATQPYAIPNPSAGNWEIGLVAEHTDLALMDMAGRVLWTGTTSTGRTTIPGEQLPAGTYLLRLSGATNGHVKLVHW